MDWKRELVASAVTTSIVPNGPTADLVSRIVRAQMAETDQRRG
jgi:hypothetical protein